MTLKFATGRIALPIASRTLHTPAPFGAVATFPPRAYSKCPPGGNVSGVSGAGVG